MACARRPRGGKEARKRRKVYSARRGFAGTLARAWLGGDMIGEGRRVAKWRKRNGIEEGFLESSAAY